MLLGSNSEQEILPDMTRRRVDFPAPLGPTMARISELLASKETEFNIGGSLLFNELQQKERGFLFGWGL